MGKIQNLNTWVGKLKPNAQGEPLRNLSNTIIALNTAPEFKGLLRYNALSHRLMIHGDLPWELVPEPRPLDDRDAIKIMEWLQNNGLDIGRETVVHNALVAVCGDHSYNPVTDYLNALVWDGERRLDAWSVKYLGVTDSDYVSIVGRKTLVGAVARALEPGCKMDTVLVLEGEQGSGKSSAIRVLGNPWVLEGICDMRTKEGQQQIQGYWLVEESELGALKKSEAEHVKSFLTRANDVFRMPYGRLTKDYPRQCIFIGTTNDDRYLKDATGNRRYWPMRCHTIRLDLLERDRDQLWAEAVHAYRQGEPWWLNEEEEALARIEQEDRQVVHPWQDVIADYMRLHASPSMTTVDILRRVLDKDIDRVNIGDAKIVADAMRNLGFREHGRAKIKLNGKEHRTPKWWPQQSQDDLDFGVQEGGTKGDRGDR